MEQKRIGIIGCSRIAPLSIINPVREIETLTVYGIASRDYETTKVYARENDISYHFHDYNELLNCTDIDIVYIALPPKLHTQWIRKPAARKKPILVEKPICLSSDEFLLIENECKNNDVYLLEAVMVQHHQWQAYIRKIIKEKNPAS